MAETAWSQIISTLIFTLGTPVGIAFAIYVPRVWTQKLPEQQRHALEQFARQAVKQVEQEYAKNPGKKDLARASIATLFKAHRLPAPAAQAIDIAIEAAVQELPKHTNPPVMNG